jgi:hypothetical protein
MDKSNWRAGSSNGPDIDITAPGENVPVPSKSSTGLVNASGSSLSTGYVAGIALAYLATMPSTPSSDSATPKAFRDWLIPATQNNANPAKVGTAAAYPMPDTANVRRSPYKDSASYNHCVPKLRVTQWPW